MAGGSRSVIFDERPEIDPTSGSERRESNGVKKCSESMGRVVGRDEWYFH
jgi:hypothetical protein